MPTNSTGLEFVYDLTLDEVRRRAAVLAAMYGELVSAGVLPDREMHRASD